MEHIYIHLYIYLEDFVHFRTQEKTVLEDHIWTQKSNKDTKGKINAFGGAR